MDTQDLNKIEVPPMGPDPLKQMWELQKELVEEYKVIEKWPSQEFPFNLDIKDNQMLVKDFISRVIEEIAESYEYLIADKINKTLLVEELVDAIHFLLEIGVTTLTYEEFIITIPVKSGNPIKDAFSAYREVVDESLSLEDIEVATINLSWGITYTLNLARNTLRNKPWKQTQVKTHKTPFVMNVSRALFQLLYLFFIQGLSEREIYEAYYKKNRINWFRIKSKY